MYCWFDFLLNFYYITSIFLFLFTKKIHQNIKSRKCLITVKNITVFLSNMGFFSLLTDRADNDMPLEYLYTIIQNNN